eukprot:88313-Amphidinium_carterae.1
MASEASLPPSHGKWLVSKRPTHPSKRRSLPCAQPTEQKLLKLTCTYSQHFGRTLARGTSEAQLIAMEVDRLGAQEE